jgi:hypothetical protein
MNLVEWRALDSCFVRADHVSHAPFLRGYDHERCSATRVSQSAIRRREMLLREKSRNQPRPPQFVIDRAVERKYAQMKAEIAKADAGAADAGAAPQDGWSQLAASLLSRRQKGQAAPPPDQRCVGIAEDGDG